MSLSSRREFLARSTTAAAAVALPTCCDGAELPVRVLEPKEQEYSVVRLPDYKLMWHALSHDLAVSACRYYNELPHPYGRRAVMVREVREVRLVGEPIEVKGRRQ